MVSEKPGVRVFRPKRDYSAEASIANSINRVQNTYENSGSKRYVDYESPKKYDYR